MIRKLAVTSAVITVLLSGGVGYLGAPAFAATQDVKSQMVVNPKEDTLEVFNIVPVNTIYDAVVSAPPRANHVVDGKLTNGTTRIEIDTRLKLLDGTKLSLIRPSGSKAILTQDYVQGVNFLDIPEGTFQSDLYIVQLIFPTSSGPNHVNLFSIYNL